MTADYTVRLEQVFQGPMDLLLHLVREQEVDIHEIEINRVIDGYLAYLRDMREIDIELAADFLLMAATLMSIKSRSLLPGEEVDLEEELDPRDELIQRLVEYRRFKEASRDLAGRLEERARLHPRGFRPPEEEEPALDVGELSQWDLLSAFSRLMRETLAHRALEIATDERPLRYYVERLVGWMKEHRQASLRELVTPAAGEERASRSLLIGTFCALLELMKIGVVRAWQPHPRGDIRIAVRDDVEGDLEELVRLSGLDDEIEVEPFAPESAPESAAEAPSAAARAERAGPEDPHEGETGEAGLGDGGAVEESAGGTPGDGAGQDSPPMPGERGERG